MSSVDLLFILIFLLIGKHTVVDFFLQTKKQIAAKHCYADWTGVEHSVQHGIGTLLCVYAATQNWTWAVCAGLADAIIHYHIDYAKVKLSCQDHNSAKYWHWFGVDQALHMLTYLAIGISIAKL